MVIPLHHWAYIKFKYSTLKNEIIIITLLYIWIRQTDQKSENVRLEKSQQPINKQTNIKTQVYPVYRRNILDPKTQIDSELKGKNCALSKQLT